MEEKEAAKFRRDNLAYERENKKLVKEYHKLLKKHKRLQKDFKNLSGENDRNKRLLRSKDAKPTARPPRGGWSIGKPGGSKGWK